MSYHSIFKSRLSRGKVKKPLDLSTDSGSQELHPDSKKLYEIADNLAHLRTQEIILQSSTQVINKNRFITAVSAKLFGRNWQPQELTVDALKRRESQVGASLFDKGRPNERIEFFNDSRTSWFFYQSITGSNGNSESVTLHYEVHPNGIMRVSNRGGMKCEFISGQEYDNFVLSAHIYHKRVKKHIYNKADLDKASK